MSYDKVLERKRDNSAIKRINKKRSQKSIKNLHLHWRSTGEKSGYKGWFSVCVKLMWAAVVCQISKCRRKTQSIAPAICLPALNLQPVEEKISIHHRIQTLHTRVVCCVLTCPFSAWREGEQNKYAISCGRSADLQQDRCRKMDLLFLLNLNRI